MKWCGTTLDGNRGVCFDSKDAYDAYLEREREKVEGAAAPPSAHGPPSAPPSSDDSDTDELLQRLVDRLNNQTVKSLDDDEIDGDEDCSSSNFTGRPCDSSGNVSNASSHLRPENLTRD